MEQGLYLNRGCAVQTEVSGGDKSKSLGRPRFSGIGHVYAGLSDEEVEVCSPLLGIPRDMAPEIFLSRLIVVCSRSTSLVFCLCHARLLMWSVAWAGYAAAGGERDAHGDIGAHQGGAS